MVMYDGWNRSCLWCCFGMCRIMELLRVMVGAGCRWIMKLNWGNCIVVIVDVRTELLKRWLNCVLDFQVMAGWCIGEKGGTDLVVWIVESVMKKQALSLNGRADEVVNVNQSQLFTRDIMVIVWMAVTLEWRFMEFSQYCVWIESRKRYKFCTFSRKVRNASFKSCSVLCCIMIVH